MKNAYFLCVFKVQWVMTWTSRHWLSSLFWPDRDPVMPSSRTVSQLSSRFQFTRARSIIALYTGMYCMYFDRHDWHWTHAHERHARASHSMPTNLSRLLDNEVEFTRQEELESHNFMKRTKPKVLFGRIYQRKDLPCVTEMVHTLTCDLCFPQNSVISAIEAVVPDYSGICDDNIFSAIALYLLKNSLNEIDIYNLATFALPLSTKCNKKRVTLDYICMKKQFIYRRCRLCRSDNTPKVYVTTR